MLPSGTFHCLCSLTRSQGDFQFLEVSTSRRGTPYPAARAPLTSVELDPLLGPAMLVIGEVTGSMPGPDFDEQLDAKAHGKGASWAYHLPSA